MYAYDTHSFVLNVTIIDVCETNAPLSRKREGKPERSRGGYANALYRTELQKNGMGG